MQVWPKKDKKVSGVAASAVRSTQASKIKIKKLKGHMAMPRSDHQWRLPLPVSPVHFCSLFLEGTNTVGNGI